MRLRIAVPEDHVSPAVIDAALEAVTRLDESMIRTGAVPLFRDQAGAGGVQWAPEPFSDEHFDHAATALQRGWADCDDLAPWHAASLRASGEDPGAFARVVSTGPTTYHAIVQRSDGAIDDPSLESGMNGKRVSGGPGDVLNIQATDPRTGRLYVGALPASVAPLRPHGPAISVRKVGALWIGRCDLPWGDHSYAMSATCTGDTSTRALVNAIAGVVSVADASKIGGTVDRLKLGALQRLMIGVDPDEVCVWLQNEAVDYEQACAITDRMRKIARV
jgi:hypothetical protein